MKIIITVCSFLFFVVSFAQKSQDVPKFRAPSVPLVAHDPYFSIW